MQYDFVQRESKINLEMKKRENNRQTYRETKTNKQTNRAPKFVKSVLKTLTAKTILCSCDGQKRPQ